MFDRLEKPFLTVETGEAYQPVRLTYVITDKEALLKQLAQLKCLQKNTQPQSWTWYWRGECDDLHFESVTSYKRDKANALRLGTLLMRDDKLFINLSSFKRACMAVSFFYKVIDAMIARVQCADFINKVFTIDERLPHGFSELLDDESLDIVLNERVIEYQKIKEKCEQAATADEAFHILDEYTKKEAKKKIPYAERYSFEVLEVPDPEIIFLSFYIFMRAREIVAIKRWLGNPHYNLSDAADDTIEKVFGGLGIDLIE